MIVEIILLNLGVLFGIAWWMSGKQPDSLKVLFWTALLVKLLAGLAVGWLYFYYYYGAGDTLSYWKDGSLLSDKIIAHPFDGLDFYWDENNSNSMFTEGLLNNRPRSLFFIKISGLLAILSGSNYWMMAVLISFISFLGAWYLFRKTILFFPSSGMAAAISFLFYPSVVFWSSGLIKESLGLAALFFLTGIFLTLIKHQKVNWWEWIMMIMSLWIGWNLKYYWIGVFVPIILTTTVIVWLKPKISFITRYDLITWLALFIIISLIGTSIHPNFYPGRFLDVIVQNNREFMSLANSGNAVHYDNLNATLTSVLINSPQALVAGLFRPFFWEGVNFISIIAGIENFILLIMLGISLPATFTFLKSPDRLLGIAIITYSIILAIFLAMSTPNFGTLSRYKIGFLPFLVFLVLYQNPIIIRLKSKK